MKDEFPGRTVPDECDFCSASKLHDALNEKLDPATAILVFDHLSTCPVCKKRVEDFMISEKEEFRKELFGDAYDGYDRVNLSEAENRLLERLVANVIRRLNMEFDEPGSS